MIVKSAEEQGFKVRDGKFLTPHGTRRLRIDVGLSENAPQSEVWLSEYEDLFVIGFEPNPVSCKKIEKGNSCWPVRLSAENKARLLLVNCGLGNKSDFSEKFYVTSPDEGQSSFLPPIGIDVKEIIRVPMETLDDLADQIDWVSVGKVEYLKLDCQGYDLEVLKGAKSLLRDKVQVCTAEASAGQYAGESNNLKDIVDFMQSIGFKYINPRRNFWAKIKYRRILKHFNVDDPTFINVKFYYDFLESPFSVIQKG